jgi:hypothetical protein
MARADVALGPRDLLSSLVNFILRDVDEDLGSTTIGHDHEDAD